MLELYEIDVSHLSGGILSSVVPQLTNILKDAAEKLIHKEITVVGPGLKTGLNIVIDNPGQLGSDLLVDAVAAMAENPLPVIVVDLGTATTFCLVNEKKQYVGGLVMPGIRTGLDSLVTRTSLLPHIQLKKPEKVIGTNTMDAMRNGVIHGNAAMIDGVISRIEEEMGTTCSVVATGGLAKYIIPVCRRSIKVDEDLLLKGLKILYDKNSDRNREKNSGGKAWV